MISLIIAGSGCILFSIGFYLGTRKREISDKFRKITARVLLAVSGLIFITGICFILYGIHRSLKMLYSWAQPINGCASFFATELIQ